MATGLEAAAIGLAGNLLKKPFEDLYTSCASGVKSFVRAWVAAGAVDRIEQTIEDLERIRTIVSRQASTLTEIYYPAKLIYKKNTINMSQIDDIAGKKNILITGTAGQGKSVLMRYLAVQELRLGKRVPLFIELRRIDKSNDLISLLRSNLHLQTDGSEDDVLNQLLQRGHVVLILDGFDEIPREFVLSVRERILALATKHKSIQIVISSRPGALCAHIQELPNLAAVEVAPLRDTDFKPFLQKIGTEEHILNRLITAIDNSSTEVKKLLKTPLMLTLLVLTCGGKQQIPDTLPEFYDSLFRVLAVMHDETKPGYVREMATKLTYMELEQVFECFSFVSREQFDRTSLSPLQFDESVRAAIAYTNLECTVEGFKTDVSETVCLMVREGIDTTFIHKSIQEYYTARFIRSLPDDEAAIQAYDSITDTRLLGWQAEIRFLEQIDPIRFKIFFRKKQIENFLKKCDYKKNSRKVITKVALAKCLSFFEPIRVGSGYAILWVVEGKTLDTIILQDIASDLSRMLHSTTHQDKILTSSLFKLIDSDAEMFSDVISIFETRIKACLKELDDIAHTEARRKNALMNILKKK